MKGKSESVNGKYRHLRQIGGVAKVADGEGTPQKLLCIYNHACLKSGRKWGRSCRLEDKRTSVRD
jgi:hypothetical protein